MAGLDVSDLYSIPAEQWVPLVGYAAAEISACFANISEACTAHQQGRPLPSSLYGPRPPLLRPEASTPQAKTRGRPPKAARDPSKPKPKRKESAYNRFVKERIEALKAEGYQAEDEGLGNALFKKAVNEWKEMSDAERAEYTLQFKARMEAAGEAADAAAPDQAVATPAPAPTPSAAEAPADDAIPAPVEKKKRKKDKGERSEKKKHKSKHRDAESAE